VELGETPADAAVREMWEETGLHVELLALASVFGGSECFVRYANGDVTEYVVTGFTARVIGGTLRADGEETSACRYVEQSEARALPLSVWLRTLLPLVFATREGSVFQPASWRPPIA
jgi:ADP-ribose pyrophosphatase YjhB (NUDIX family)